MRFHLEYCNHFLDFCACTYGILFENNLIEALGGVSLAIFINSNK